MSERTGPLAVPAGTEGDHPHYPAGWVSPEAAMKADRQALREQIAREREAANRDDLEAEVDRRLTAARAAQEPAAEPEPEDAK
jgi:hypothetical protein